MTECKPENCPIVEFSVLTPKEQIANRQSSARELDGRGFTLEQIAMLLNSSKSTIARDLESNFPTVGKLKPAKTASNPKGAGRPKGSKAPRQSTRGKETPKLDRAREIVRDLLEAGKPISPHKLQEAHGDISHVTFDMAITAELARTETLAELEVDPNTLSMSAQQKLATAVKQEQRKLEMEIRQQMQVEFQKRLADLLVDYREKEKHYNIVISKRKGFMKRALFARFRFALHPDTYKNVDVAERNELVDAWEKLKVIMLDEKEAPATGRDLPKTLEEWDKAKQEATAARKAKYAASRNRQQVSA